MSAPLEIGVTRALIPDVPVGGAPGGGLRGTAQRDAFSVGRGIEARRCDAGDRWERRPRQGVTPMAEAIEERPKRRT